MNDSTPLIEVRAAGKRYHGAGRDDIVILDGIDLCVQSGEIVGLLGPSGCGKSTLLNAIAGFSAPSRGQVQVEQRTVTAPGPDRGMVFQEYALFPWMTVAQNVAFGLEIKGMPRRAIEPRVAGLLAMLKLTEFRDRFPKDLSGGMRQRVAIARALATSPKLLLMDEPLAALDAKRKAEVLPYLDRLHEELGIPIVYVSHAIDEVARLADHLVLMDAGRVLAEGPLPDMLARLDLPVAFGDDAGVVLDAVIAERDAQWQLARLEVDGDACSLWSRDAGLPVGRRVRLRVLARDVSLTRTPQTGTSIGNQLRGTIEAIADDAHPALALVRVRVGASPVVARLSKRSAHALQLAVGMPVWAQHIGEVLPLTHFLRIVRGILLKGNDLVDVLPELWPMLAFLAVNAPTRPGRIIAVSSYAPAELASLGRLPPQVPLLPKPIDRNRFIALARHCISADTLIGA